METPRYDFLLPYNPLITHHFRCLVRYEHKSPFEHKNHELLITLFRNALFRCFFSSFSLLLTVNHLLLTFCWFIIINIIEILKARKERKSEKKRRKEKIDIQRAPSSSSSSSLSKQTRNDGIPDAE